MLLCGWFFVYIPERKSVKWKNWPGLTPEPENGMINNTYKVYIYCTVSIRSILRNHYYEVKNMRYNLHLGFDFNTVQLYRRREKHRVFTPKFLCIGNITGYGFCVITGASVRGRGDTDKGER